MNIKAKLVCFVLCLLFLQCSKQNNLGEEKTVSEIMNAPAIKNSEIVRSPVSAMKETDTVNVAKLTFEEAVFDFGESKEGEIIQHTYAFVNTGKKPLLISNAKSTCGCTVPDWPKTPILPGEKGSINVRFDTKNKTGKQSKPITITANTYPSETKVYLNGYVNNKATAPK